MSLIPQRTVTELKELRELTSDENGAQRVAWTETWETFARRATASDAASRSQELTWLNGAPHRPSYRS